MRGCGCGLKFMGGAKRLTKKTRRSSRKATRKNRKTRRNRK
jgi:hypothetical protein